MTYDKGTSEHIFVKNSDKTRSLAGEASKLREYLPNHEVVLGNDAIVIDFFGFLNNNNVKITQKNGKLEARVSARGILACFGLKHEVKELLEDNDYTFVPKQTTPEIPEKWHAEHSQEFRKEKYAEAELIKQGINPLILSRKQYEAAI